ncbi:MAG: tetratricopeptide repeat protein [Chitinivibrionales bacterium]
MREWVLGFFLFAAVFAAYQPAWNGKPIWDDDRHITRPELRSADGLARIWTYIGVTQQYYPLTHTVFWIEYRLWGGSTLGYHLVNIFLHFFSALLLVRVLRRLAIPGAWFIAAIFALHPAQVESVAWITELKNTLSGVFFFATALAYLKFDSERKGRYYAIAVFLFVLGLMSKSVIATLPVPLLAMFWWKRGRVDWKRDVVPLAPFFALGILCGLFTSLVERKFIGAEGSAFDFTLIERCLIAGRAIWFYLSKIILPVNLTFIYPRWNVSQAVWWQFLFPLSALLLAGVLWKLRSRSRAPLAAFIYFTAMLFPVLGFFNVYPFQYSFVADHFQYLACLGPIALLVGGTRSVGLLKENGRRLLYIIVLLTLGLLTWSQCRMYADAETLFRTTIRKNPGCWMAHDNLGNLLRDRGRKDEAMAQYRASLECNPHDYVAYANLGKMLTDLGRTSEAAADFQKALDIKPAYADAHYGFGLLLAKAGQTDEAIAHDRKALETEPDDIVTLRNLATLLVRQGKLTDAVPVLQRVLALEKSSGNESRAQEIAGLLEMLNQAGGR